MSMKQNDIEFIIDCLKQGKDVPAEYKYALFPSVHKEYELNYSGKARKEDVLADNEEAKAVPLQVEKVFSQTDPNSKDWQNLLVFGDNLQFLKTLYENEDPLIKGQVKGKVQLIYIDPPFATQDDFKNNKGAKAYSDKTKGAEFVEFLRRRLIVARELLDDSGSMIVHLDSKKSHYMKVVLDEVFGENNFINEIIWHKGREGGSSRSHSQSSAMPTEYQNILIYAKKREARYWKPILGPYKESTVNNIQLDEIGWYYSRGRMGRKPAAWEIEKGVGLKTYVLKDPTKTKQEALKLITGPGAEFVAIGDVWDKNFIKSSQFTDYPTEKPEALLKNLIQASTRENDIVMDFFAGSGTTLAVAEKMGRRWIGCDIGKLSVYTIQKRLMEISHSKDLANSRLKYNHSAKPFVVATSGLYDLSLVFNLAKEEYIEFVKRLFEVENSKTKSISGVSLDGKRRDSYVKIFPYWELENSTVNEEYVEELHKNIGSRLDGRMYIIAPANNVDFISDYIQIDNVKYYFLRVPYQIIKELHKVQFKKLRQPQSKKRVNDLDEAIGFHFIRQPEVKSAVLFDDDEIIFKIKKFESAYLQDETGKKLSNFESLAMVLFDLDYNGEYFMLSKCFFANDLVALKDDDDDENHDDEIRAELKERSEIVIKFADEECKKQIMVIYVDIYGNEFREVHTVG